MRELAYVLLVVALLVAAVALVALVTDQPLAPAPDGEGFDYLTPGEGSGAP